MPHLPVLRGCINVFSILRDIFSKKNGQFTPFSPTHKRSVGVMGEGSQ